MAWRRLGLIYPGHRAATHAALPAPLHLQGDVFRFFFSARDPERRSHVYWADIEIGEKPRLIGDAVHPVMSPGEDGTFDDSGVSIGCVLRTERDIRLYYMGWNLGVRSPWRNSIGLAIAADANGPFRRYAPGPIMDRSPQDPYTLTYPYVMREEPGRWRMWYGSNLSPALDDANLRHLVNHAWSRDGATWERDGKPVTAFTKADDYVVVKPSVLRTSDGWLMACAARGPRYRIEMRTSVDGLNWQILADADLEASGGGWDSEMVCYPALFMHQGRLWLAHNGNGYGETGIGLALWEGNIP